MKKVYLLLADGFEDIEAMTPVDVLRRCGADIKTVSISDKREVTSSHHVEVKADLTQKNSDINDGDMIILPGGFPGYENLGNSKEVGSIVKKYYDDKKYVGAICGAPTVLAKNSIAKDKKLTCHTGVKDKMAGYNYVGGDTVIDGNLITGVGAGHSLDFALLLASILVDNDTLNKVKKGMEIR